MVRATAIEMLKLFGGVHPPPHDATSFGAVCPHADALIDAYVYPCTVSTTSTVALGVANRVAVHIINHSLWIAAGAELTGVPMPVMLTREVKLLLDNIKIQDATGSIAVVGMLDEDA